MFGNEFIKEMDETPLILDDLCAIAIDASIEAGAAILKHYHKGFEVRYKSDQSPLTDADIASHQCIVEILSITRLPLLSEEEEAPSWNVRRNWERYWLIDPLDGTKEFVKRNGEFAVNIALMEDGFPVFGVIFIPVGNELYFGGKEMGAYRLSTGKDEPLNAKATLAGRIETAQRLPGVKKSNDIGVLISRSHASEQTEEWIKRMKKHVTSLKPMNVGSSIKFCRVAEGAAQIYPRFSPTMQWDTAAGQAIAEGAGMSVVSRENNKRLKYHRELINPNFMVYDLRYVSPETIEL